MEVPETLAKVATLSVDDRLDLIDGDEWDPNEELPPLTEAQWAEIGRRLANYKRNPESALTREEVLESVHKRIRHSVAVE